VCSVKTTEFRPVLCLGQSADTVIVYGEVEILMMLLNMIVIHRRSMCAAL